MFSFTTCIKDKAAVIARTGMTKMRVKLISIDFAILGETKISSSVGIKRKDLCIKKK